MTIPNYDQEIERKYHPENFEPARPIRIKSKIKRGSAKEARSIQHKKLYKNKYTGLIEDEIFEKG